MALSRMALGLVVTQNSVQHHRQSEVSGINLLPGGIRMYRDTSE